MFRKREHRGWWPFLDKDKDNKYIVTVRETSKSYSSSFFHFLGTSFGNFEKGKVEMQFTLLSEKEAEEHPAGEGRNPPEALPPPT